MHKSKIEILQQTIDEDPDNPFAHFALAREYLKADNKEKAREYYDHLVHHFPTYGGTYYHYAILLIEENDVDAALKMMNQGIEILRKTNEPHLLSELRALRQQLESE